MPTTKNLYVVLIFALGLRAFLATVLKSDSSDVNYYLRISFQLCMYLTLALSCGYLLRKDKTCFFAVIGRVPCRSQIFLSIGTGIGLFGFSLGEHAFEVFLFAQVDAEQAYQFGNFRTSVPAGPPLLSIDVLAGVTIGCIIAPCVEEFFFRGLLLQATCSRFRYATAVLLTSGVFALLHYVNYHYVGVVVFSVVVSCFYRYGNTLIPCIVIHATYNFISFVYENYLDFHLTRSEDKIAKLEDWIPQFVMLVMSLSLLFLIFRRRYSSFTIDQPHL